MTRLDRPLVRQITERLERGLSRAHAAAAERVHKAVLRNWMKRGEDALIMIADGHQPNDYDSLCADLVVGIEAAEAKHAGALVTDVTAPDAPAAVKLKWLQLRFPEEYGDVKHVKHGLDDAATATLEETMAELGIPFDKAE